MRWSVTFISIEVAVSMLGYLRKAFFISCVNVIMQYCWVFGGGGVWLSIQQINQSNCMYNLLEKQPLAVLR